MNLLNLTVKQLEANEMVIKNYNLVTLVYLTISGVPGKK